MSANWSVAVLLAAEFTFAVLFVRSLLGYLRRRDPLLRDITWVFAPPAVLFAINVADLLPGQIPAWVRLVSAAAPVTPPQPHVPAGARLVARAQWRRA